MHPGYLLRGRVGGPLWLGNAASEDEQGRAGNHQAEGKHSHNVAKKRVDVHIEALILRKHECGEHGKETDQVPKH